MEKVQADKDEILRYAKKQFYSADVDSRWNGRQIYNAFKTAIALAEYERSQQQEGDGGSKKNKPAVLTEAHFRQVARVAKKFDDYLLETHGGMTMAATNQQQKVRADHFEFNDDGANGSSMRLKRRPTKTRKLDLDEIPSSSDEGGESSDSESGLSEDEEKDSSEEEEVVVKKKSKNKGDSSSKKNEEKSSKKKSQSSKSKKTSRRQIEEESEDSSS